MTKGYQGALCVASLSLEKKLHSFGVDDMPLKILRWTPQIDYK